MEEVTFFAWLGSLKWKKSPLIIDQYTNYNNLRMEKYLLIKS